jgi:hypothetical protein
MSARRRRHSSFDLSDMETDMKRHRLSDLNRGMSKMAAWRIGQQSISRVLTPYWTGLRPNDSEKQSSSSDLSSDETETQSSSLSNRLIQSFESISRNHSNRIESEKKTLKANTSEVAGQGKSLGDLFEVTNPRYQNVGLLLTLGESNYPCSRKDQADTDLALIFKYTHFT